MPSAAAHKRRKRNAPMAGAALCTAVLLMAVAAFAWLWPQIGRTMQYPVEYADLVRENAERFHLEEAHVFAVIACESSFRREALSSAGAMGLMQIMPETGKWIAGKLEEEDSFTPEMLNQPEVNVRYGCWLLGYLSRLYDGDLDTVSAAYHAGSGNVDKWLRDEQWSRDGRTIEATPYSSTNSYMKKVHAAYEAYKQILGA